MTRLEIFQEAKNRGVTYNPETGEVIGIRGNLLTAKNRKGYIQSSIIIEGKSYNFRVHIFAWFYFYGEAPPDKIDHKDTIKDNNKIDNLRIVTNQENMFNTNAKGYSWNKTRQKWQAQIMIDYKTIYLGLFILEEDARQAYLDAKKIYHIIDTY